MLSSLSKLPALILIGFQKFVRRLFMQIYRPLFGAIGRNVWFDPFGRYHPHGSVFIGNDVYLGPGTTIMASGSRVTIGDKVMFGPDVILVTGRHNTSAVGRYMYDVKDKRPGDDLPITVEDDVWVGARATILRGVVIGRGSVVASNAVVTRSVPPYSIVMGAPARVVRSRWSTEEIQEHERKLAASSPARRSAERP